MTDGWYWRDKPLSTNNQKQGQKYWVDQGTLAYSMSLCYEHGLNCTMTCCKQTYCAPVVGECINYIRRDYWELYICFIVTLTIVLGIPTCIKTMEFLLMYKFCRKFDQDENTYVGGTTICEGMTNLFTPKKKGPQNMYTFEAEEDEDDEVDEAGQPGEKRKVSSSNMPKGALKKKNKKRGKCATCCRSFFCCKFENTAKVKEPEFVMMSKQGPSFKTVRMAAEPKEDEVNADFRPAVVETITGGSAPPDFHEEGEKMQMFKVSPSQLFDK